MKLLSRKEVPVELTWDLTLLYENTQAFEADVAKIYALSEEIEQDYKGKLSSVHAIKNCVTKLQRFYELISLTSNYCELLVSADFSDAENMKISEKALQIIAQATARISFAETEIASQPSEIIEQAICESAPNSSYLKDILRNKPHQLSLETEKVLATLAPTFETPYNIYNMTKMADMVFEPFTVNGKEYPLGYALYEDNYEYEVDTAVRRSAFKHFYDKLRSYQQVTATAYNARVTYEKTMASLRGFDSVYDYLLFSQKVTRPLYDRQIDLIMEKLAPHMRKYAKLIQKLHGLEEMTYADLKLPLDPGYDPRVTIEGSKEYIENGLAIMGEDYVDMIRTAYKERWVDFAQNQGKCTGGFCCSPYGKGSFILLSWNDRMSDVFTLAHELGHAGHFKACNAAQSVFDTEVSRYFVEAPSTMNELLMAHYLEKTSDDPRFKRWILSCMVGKTYYHNMVTHLLEAAYQREVYQIIDAGGSVQAETLSQIFRRVLERFWGDTVVIPEGSELTWMRQPHYYIGLYPYTYSAGLTIATQMCKRIETEGQPAVEDWKKVLRAGSSLEPVELAKLGGIDISTDQPLLDTIDTIGQMVEEMWALSDL